MTAARGTDSESEFFETVSRAIRGTARRTGRSPVDIKREFAFSRFLYRLFRYGRPEWVLKGGASVMARYYGAARDSEDLDLFIADGVSAALRDLEGAVKQDSGDFFRFLVHKDFSNTSSWLQPLEVDSVMNREVFSSFKVDMVTDTLITGSPELVTPPAPLGSLGLPVVPYRLYPVVDQIADKVSAMIESSAGLRPHRGRFRDLVDLVIILSSEHGIEAPSLRRAVRAELNSRKCPIPTMVNIPDPSWEQGYSKIVSSLPRIGPRSANDALAMVRLAIDPVLTNSAAGVWSPSEWAWSGPESPSSVEA